MMATPQSKYTAMMQSDGTERLESLTDEFFFVIYRTVTGNRKTLAIYRLEDGLPKENPISEKCFNLNCNCGLPKSENARKGTLRY